MLVFSSPSSSLGILRCVTFNQLCKWVRFHTLHNAPMQRKENNDYGSCHRIWNLLKIDKNVSNPIEKEIISLSCLSSSNRCTANWMNWAICGNKKKNIKNSQEMKLWHKIKWPTEWQSYQRLSINDKFICDYWKWWNKKYITLNDSSIRTTKTEKKKKINKMWMLMDAARVHSVPSSYYVVV